MNDIETYDFQIPLNYMILNAIDIYIKLNFITKAFKICIILTSILSFVNKSLTISILPFLTASYNAVMLNIINVISISGILKISLKYLYCNFIIKYILKYDKKYIDGFC